MADYIGLKLVVSVVSYYKRIKLLEAGNGKKIIDQYVSSAVCMFKVANIEEINNISRKLGNRTITKISEFIKRSISDN